MAPSSTSIDRAADFICLSHGRIPGNGCPQCAGEVYRSDDPECREFVGEWLRHRRTTRLTVAVAAGLLAGLVVRLRLGPCTDPALDEAARIGLPLLGAFALALVSPLLQSPALRRLESFVLGRRGLRVLSSVPMLLALAIGTIFAWSLLVEPDVVFELAMPAPSPFGLADSTGGMAWLTHPLAHRELAHLLGSLLGLLGIGLVLDLHVGRRRCATIVLVSTLAAALAHRLGWTASLLPLAGASALVFGLAGATLSMIPRVPVRLALPLTGVQLTFPAWAVVAAVLPTVEVFLWLSLGRLAFASQLAALSTGLLLGRLLRRPGDALGA